MLAASAASWLASLLAEASTNLPGWVTQAAGYAACATAILVLLMQTRKVTLYFLRDVLRISVAVFKISRKTWIYRLKDAVSQLLSDSPENASSSHDDSANSANDKN